VTGAAGEARGAAGRGRLAWYALYQLRDYMLEKGIATAALSALIAAVPIIGFREQYGPEWAAGEAGAARVTQLLRVLAVMVASLATVFAVNGISAIDRQRGYVRFLFAKPVSVPVYYAQDFVVRMAGMLLVMAILVGLLAVATPGMPPRLGVVALAALVYVLLGGLGFLFSALVRFDGLLLILVWLVADILHQLYGDASGAVRYLLRVLPPIHKLEAAVNAHFGGPTVFSAFDLAWVVGYGLACFAAGLVVLRRRSLAT
jgi:hypothetical protein